MCAAGLQIRVGPSDGLRWVRLPSSSATSTQATAIYAPAAFQPRAAVGTGQAGVFTPCAKWPRERRPAVA